MKLGLIYAQSRNGVIGKDGVMPWHLPEDLAHLKKMTMGCPVIMGRKTWDSLPPRFRPLPGRTNVVITRQADFNAPGGTVVASLDDALAHCRALAAANGMVWIIGGAQIYSLAAPFADIAVVTEIDADFDGDTFAPTLGANWVETQRERHESSTGVRYSFVTFKNTSRGD
ncbi:dihydrofolate reductase [Caenimonas koreensis]|uniref:dihydrofolate reductase n=1 Tax=Caenimonas koreensis TaxID=367474 RepID=UPI0037849166